MAEREIRKVGQNAAEVYERQLRNFMLIGGGHALPKAIG
jgi:hypothetical protein